MEDKKVYEKFIRKAEEVRAESVGVIRDYLAHTSTSVDVIPIKVNRSQINTMIKDILDRIIWMNTSSVDRVDASDMSCIAVDFLALYSGVLEDKGSRERLVWMMWRECNAPQFLFIVEHAGPFKDDILRTVEKFVKELEVGNGKK